MFERFCSRVLVFLSCSRVQSPWLQLQATRARNREELRLSREQLQVTFERNREELHLSLEGQVTERFTRAIEQLGSDNLAVRLGGIYALERIAKDSPRDHGPIMEVLTTFVRERARWKSDQPLAEKTQTQTPSTDIQAILTILGRRVIHEKWREPTSLDLSQTDLRGANLRETHLERALLYRAHLQGANLIEAHLEGRSISPKSRLNRRTVNRKFLAAAPVPG
jgi:hypothetical protein